MCGVKKCLCKITKRRLDGLFTDKQSDHSSVKLAEASRISLCPFLFLHDFQVSLVFVHECVLRHSSDDPNWERFQ